MLIDITRPLWTGSPVWPGDAAVSISWSARKADGDTVNVAVVTLGMHSATHVDAPYHVLSEGAAIGEISIDRFVGPATVVDVTSPTRIEESVIDRVLGFETTERVLFRTGAWRTPDHFPAVFPALSPEAAQALVAAGVSLIGTDAPSVDPSNSSDLPAHHSLLRAGIPIVENLLLDGVPEGSYELICLPLRCIETDASPVRAVLRR